MISRKMYSSGSSRAGVARGCYSCMLAIAYCWSPNWNLNASEVKDQWLGQARQGALHYSELFRRAKGYSIKTALEHSQNVGTSERRLVEKSVSVEKCDNTKDCISFLVQSEFDLSNNLMSTCHALNSQYCFGLQKRNSEKTWQIELVKETKDPAVDMSKIGFRVPYRRPSHEQFIDRATIQSILPDDFVGILTLEGRRGFHLRSIEELDNSHVKIMFDFKTTRFFDSKAGEKENDVTVHTILTLDSNHFFLPTAIQQTIREGEFSMEFNGKKNYQFDSAGHPKTVHTECHLNASPEAGLTSEDVQLETSQFTFGPIAESEFTLSAYGIPEPAGVRWDWSIPRYVWLLIATLVSATAWLVVWRRRYLGVC